jgi:hypothetical protein
MQSQKVMAHEKCGLIQYYVDLRFRDIRVFK